MSSFRTAASAGDHVCHLRDQGAVDERAGDRVAPIVVDEEEIAQRAVDDVEP